MAADSGTTFAIRKSENVRFLSTDDEDFLTIPAWADATAYEAEQTVIVAASTGDAYNQYVCLVEHTSKAADMTAGSGATAGTLASSLWEKVENGLVYSVQSLEFTGSTSDASRKYMVNLVANTTTTNEPVTIAVTLFDISDKQAIERLFGRGDTRVFLEIFRRGRAAAGKKGIKLSGYAKVGATSISFPGDGGDITKTINFTQDDSSDDAFKEVEYTGV